MGGDPETLIVSMHFGSCQITPDTSARFVNEREIGGWGGRWQIGFSSSIGTPLKHFKPAIPILVIIGENCQLSQTLHKLMKQHVATIGINWIFRHGYVFVLF